MSTYWDWDPVTEINRKQWTIELCERKQISGSTAENNAEEESNRKISNRDFSAYCDDEVEGKALSLDQNENMVVSFFPDINVSVTLTKTQQLIFQV